MSDVSVTFTLPFLPVVWEAVNNLPVLRSQHGPSALLQQTLRV